SSSLPLRSLRRKAIILDMRVARALRSAPARDDPPMDATLDYWRALVRSDDSLPLFEAALAIAQDAYPDLPMAELLARVDGFALTLRRRLEAFRQPAAKIDALREYFADQLGFRGNANDYYDPDNSYLNRVI